tara:strand:+ start:860 stop:1264 length:405 start_codon:yes stop_codon:yes gene_type:complete
MLTMLFWKKAWTWTKHYWYWPVIILLLIFSMVTGTASREKIFQLFDKQKENYEKELQIVKEAAEKVSKEKTSIVEEYSATIKKIEDDHDVKLEKLNKEKQKELADTIKKNKDSPNKLAKEIARILSAEHHENNR